MRHYKYKLIDFLNEVQQDFADTKQFYDGDSDIGVQAGKPTEKKSEKTKGDYNLKQIANAIAAAVKSHTEVTTKLDAKKLQASGKIKVKAGKNVSVAGQAEIDIKTGKADFSVPIKIKDKEVNLNIQGLNVGNPKDLHGKDIKGSFIDPVSKKEISVGVNIDSESDQYSFTAGEKKGANSFGLSLNIDKSNYAVGGNIGFDSNDFIPSKFAPKVNVGVEYDNTGGYSTNVTASKDFKTRTGNIEISGQGKVGKAEKYGGIGLTYTPDKKDKQPQDKVGKIADKSMKKAAGYVDFGDEYKSGGLKTTKIKDEEGNKIDIPTIQKDVQDVKKDIESAAEKIRENKFIMTKKELKILIEKLIKI